MNEGLTEVGVTGVWVNRWRGNAGDSVKGHAHGCAHATLVVAGRIRLECDGAATEHAAGVWLPVPAAALHTITALEAGTIWDCVFAGDRVERA